MMQAEKCRTFLETSQCDVLISSPLKRAFQTAEIINENLNLPIVTMRAFVERSYGDAEGMTMAERSIAFVNDHVPNREDRATLTKRIMNGIERINAKYNGKKIILVAHGAVINTILAQMSKGKIGSGKTKLMNACISTIHLKDKQWAVENYNQISHLESEMDQ